MEAEQPPHSTASTWELLPNPSGWGLAVLHRWILALRSWLPVPDREQRMSRERVAMRTLQVWAVSWSRAGKELLLHRVGRERGWIQTKTEGGSE